MKIRSDFVTNSSSSSFVIAYRNLPEFDNDTITKYPFLKNYGRLIEKALFAEGNNDTTSGRVFKSKEEWNEYIVENWGWKSATTVEDILAEESGLVDMYNKAVELFEKGFYILDKSVDYDDEYCSSMLKALAEDEDNFIIIDEGC